jgi:MFS family permease
LFLRTRKHSGETAPGRDDETPLEERASLPLSDERYWLLAAALAFCCVPIGIYLNHVQPILSGSGFDLASATALGSFFALATFGGRILAGFLLDRLVPRLVAAGCMALAALGAFLIMQWAGPAFPVFAIALILIGLAYGAEADFAAFFTLRYFGLARFSMVFGTLAMVIAFAVAFGGFIAAKSADTFGNYDLATSLAPAGFAVAALLILGLALFERPDRLQVREAPKISSH